MSETIQRTLVGAVLYYGRTKPDKVAVCYQDTVLTYKELCHRMQNAAWLLQNEHNILRDDIVMLTANSKPEYIVMLLGLQYLGAITTPIDKSAMKETIVHIYTLTSATLFITDMHNISEQVPIYSLKVLYEQTTKEIEKKLDYILPDQENLAELLFTSGTTGQPKGAMLTYQNIYASMQNTWHGIGMLESDVILLPLPLNHSYGMRVLRTSLYIGATIVLQNGFSLAKEIKKNMDKYSCTAMVCVQSAMEVIYRQLGPQMGNVLSELRYIEFGAGFCSVDMKNKLKELLPNTEIHNTWGSTETGGALFLNVSKHPEKARSIGKCIQGVQVKVVNKDGKEICNSGPNNYGRMAISGDLIMSGYYCAPEITKDSIVNGWLYTNDLVYMDEDGYIYMLGRADDMINVGGKKASPIEIEGVVAEYPGIKECVCIGVDDPDGISGEVPVLYLVAGEQNEYSEKDLIRYITEHLENYKIPKRYIPIDAIPRNYMGKVDRKELKARWNEIGDMKLSNEIIENIKTRRSIRNFTEEHVPKPIVEAIVSAGMYAPSGHNMQTWRFTILYKKKDIEELKQTTELVAKRCKTICYGFNQPPVLIIVSNDTRNAYGVLDSSCAIQNMMLAAHSLGLGSVWLNPLMKICNEPEIRNLLDSYGLPKTHVVNALVAIGYPAEEGKLLAKKENVVFWV